MCANEPVFLLFELALITKRAQNSSWNCLRVTRFVRVHLISFAYRTKEKSHVGNLILDLIDNSCKSKAH